MDKKVYISFFSSTIMYVFKHQSVSFSFDNCEIVRVGT